MSAPALTLPGDIEGLLRRGSPVVLLKSEGNIPAGSTGTTYFIQDWPCAMFEWLDGTGHWFKSQEVNPSGVALDLRDATGRAHAAWWLAAQFFNKALPGEWFWVCDDTEWTVFRARGGYGESHTFYPYPDDLTRETPGLAALDPNDPRLLEDGSRHVDAEALRLVVLHVAGRAG